MQIAGRSRRAAIALFIAAACCRSAYGLDPSLDINQYAHKSWSIREGYFKSPINSIAQTHDGYLWLGTESGLLRFDGVRAVPWTPPGSDHLPSDSILRLYVGHDGTLWIGTADGLVSWNRGKLVRYPELDAYRVLALLEDHERTVWAGGQSKPKGRLCAIRTGQVRCYGDDGLLGAGIQSIHEDSAGQLWVGAGSGLWRWTPPTPKLVNMPSARTPPSIMSIVDGGDGKLLIATGPEVRQVLGRKTVPFSIPATKIALRPTTLLRDRDGGLWIGTRDQGVVHLHGGRMEVFSRSAGLSGDAVTRIFEDHEGNVWVLTLDGLDRFREFAVSTVSVEQGLSTRLIFSVLATPDGSVWMGSMDGLNRWKNGRVTVYRKASGLPDDRATSLVQDKSGGIWVVTPRGLVQVEEGSFRPPIAIPRTELFPVSADDPGGLWLSGQEGLARLDQGRVVQQFPWPQLGAKGFPTRMIASGEPGGVWIGFYGGGVAHFRDGRIRQWYRSEDGLGKGRVRGFMLDRDGALWAATDGGLSLIWNGRVTTLTSKNGLPCDTMDWVIDDDYGSTWLYSSCGLVRIPRKELDGWKDDPKRAIHSTLFESSDGLVGAYSGMQGYGPRVTKAADGKLWFLAVTGGVSVVNPRHLPVNKLPPPVHIEQVIADHNVASDLRLPALTRYLEIDYTALSFVAPEKNRFKYQLEGYDRGWQDVGNRRQAFYDNVRPRKYRFHVIASNNSGVWNETGDLLEFSIAPAYYQTTWFYASCVAAFLAMLWGLYRLRLYQIRREFNAQVDGRVDERLRVARELHDTLLQSFQASLIQMQAARNILDRRPEKVGQSLDKAITTAAGAVAEGRSAIQNLRVEPAGGADLAQLLTAAGQELAHSEEAKGNPPVFGLTVEGEGRDLEPLLQDEVYRITRELLRNAFRHAQAGRIEAEIRYESRQLRVHVRDDGKGIDPEILKAGGRAGHWGLPGMRERVDRFGGKLEFWSEAGAGTEAVLTVPAAAAYGASNGGSFSFLRRKKARS